MNFFKFIKKERGQSSIEFIITFGFSIGISFLFLGLAINYVAGFLVHYSTFMASRTYLVHDVPSGSNMNTTFQSAESAARRTYNKYNMSAFNAGSVQFNNPQEKKPIFAGAYTIFNRKISFVKFISGSKDATFLSESFLGKEPIRSECLHSICEQMEGGESCSTGMDITLYDNGC